MSWHFEKSLFAKKNGFLYYKHMWRVYVNIYIYTNTYIGEDMVGMYLCIYHIVLKQWYFSILLSTSNLHVVFVNMYSKRKMISWIDVNGISIYSRVAPLVLPCFTTTSFTSGILVAPPATTIASTLPKSKKDLKPSSSSVCFKFSNNYHKKNTSKRHTMPWRLTNTYWKGWRLSIYSSNEHSPFYVQILRPENPPSLCRHHIFFADENRPTR